MSYKIQIYSEALNDIQEATNWYNLQQNGLGARFQKQVKRQINLLKTNANNYGVRYNDIRCVLIRKFPFLIHFAINEMNKTIEVYSIIHTSRNPKIWQNERSK